MENRPATPPPEYVAGLRLSDHEGRTYTFREIADEIGGDPDTLRSWFSVGGLALLPPLDVVAEKGGRHGHRLHWRTVMLLLLALKFNEFGWPMKNGAAAFAAGAVFSAGLQLDHLQSTDGPLISAEWSTDGMRVALIDRDAPVTMIEAPLAADGFDGVGTLVIDPIGLGRFIWRLAMKQAQAEEEPEITTEDAEAFADADERALLAEEEAQAEETTDAPG